MTSQNQKVIQRKVEDKNLAKSDHYISLTNNIRRFLVLIPLTLIIGCYFVFFTYSLNHNSPIGWVIIESGILISFLAWNIYIQRVQIQKKEPMRLKVMKEQAKSTIHALPNSKVFITHVNNRRTAIIMRCFLLCLFLPDTILMLLISLSLSKEGFEDPVFKYYIFIPLFCILLTFFEFYYFQDKICADNDTISHQENSMALSEALIFCSYHLSNPLGGEQRWFELSGKRTSLSWRYIQYPLSWRETWMPIVSMEEYTQQIQQLIEYICIRTGLPLYDLSGPEPIQIYPPLEQTSEQPEEALLQEQQEDDERAMDQPQ